MSPTYKQSLLLREGGSVATDPQSRNEQSRWVKTRQHNPAMAIQKGLEVTAAVRSPPQRSAPEGALEQGTPSDPVPIMS